MAGFTIDLSNQVALITGSSRGIGKAIAITLAKAGASVVVSSRKMDACQEVVNEITKAGNKAIAIPCNTTDPAQIENLVKETEKRLGPIATLVCNAAVNPAYGTMAELEDRAFDKIMAGNVAGNIKLINLAAPGMAKRGGGSIMILSSIAGYFGSKLIGAYALSKTADIQLARNYAVELGPKNIRVNALAPGLIKTFFSEKLWDSEGGKEFEKRTPLGRFGEVDDISGVALFLASDLSKYYTGQSILVDGGVSIQDPF